MQHNNNPLTPHLQIYKWEISSLLSITHRIVGIANVFAVILICAWILSLLFGELSYETTSIFLNSLIFILFSIMGFYLPILTLF